LPRFLTAANTFVDLSLARVPSGALVGIRSVAMGRGIGSESRRAPHARRRPRFPVLAGSHPQGPGSGEPCPPPAPATHGPPPCRAQTAPAQERRQSLLGVALAGLGTLGQRSLSCPSRHSGPLASPRLSPLLALEVAGSRSASRTLDGARPASTASCSSSASTSPSSTVSRLMPRRRKPPSQTWRTFLANHAGTLACIEFLMVPTATFRVFYVFLVLSVDRRKVVHWNVTFGATAEWDRPADRRGISRGHGAALPAARPRWRLRNCV
jgi:hypothetical protein